MTGQPSSPEPVATAAGPHHEVAILGAGFAGICMAIRLRQAGYRDLVIYEKADAPGGTWRDNTYPGCGCDVPSHLYSFSFARNPNWSRRFAPQPEILGYVQDVVARHRLEPLICPNTSINSLRWEAGANRWRLTATDGRQFTATVVISGMGGLHIPAVPELPNRESFSGTSFHSARWRHDVDLRGKRVAVIGTGASAVQFIPEIAPEVAQLTVFQRTPPWVLPRNERRTSAFGRAALRYVPGLQQAWRQIQYWTAERIAIGFTLKPKLVGTNQKRSAAFLQSQVADPMLRLQLTPQYSLGCKRVLLSDDYYATLTRPNVELVTRRIARLAPEGIVTGNGQRWPADVIIYATGFKPFNLTHDVHIEGRDGRLLADDWADGPEAYKGVAIAGYPNFFMLMGPNSGLGHNSILLMIEAQAGYIAKCLSWLRRPGWRGGPLRAIEVRREAQQAYNAWLERRFARTIWQSAPQPHVKPCASWYAPADGRNHTLWPSFAAAYAWALRRPNPACFFDAAAAAASQAGGRRPALRRRAA